MSATVRLTASPWLLLTALIVAEVVSAFEGAMIWAAMRVLYDLLEDPVLVGWVITSYFLVSGGACVIGARLADLFGRRRVLVWVLAIAGFGSMVCALWPENLTMLLLGRAIQGVSAAILPICYGLAREHLPQKMAMSAVGLLAATIGLAAGSGLLLGGMIVDHLDWYWIFYLSAALTPVAIVLIRAWVPDSDPTYDGRGVDIVGGILFAPGIMLFLFAISQARHWGWGDERILLLLVGSGLTLVLWAAYELRHRSPMVDLRLFANRQAALSLLAMVLCCGAFQANSLISLLVQAPTWTGAGLGLSATTAGGIMFASQLAGMPAGPWAARLLYRHSARHAMLIGGLILSVAWIGMTLDHGSPWTLLPLLLLHGFGLTMIFAIVPMALMQVVPPERTSEATGVVSVVRQIFIGVGSQIMAVLLATATVADAPGSGKVYPAPSAFLLVFAAITTSAVLICLIALALSKPRAMKQEGFAEPA